MHTGSRAPKPVATPVSEGGEGVTPGRREDPSGSLVPLLHTLDCHSAAWRDATAQLAWSLDPRLPEPESKARVKRGVTVVGPSGYSL